MDVNLSEKLILVGSMPPPHNGQTVAFQMLVQSACALPLKVSIVNLPTRDGSEGDKTLQVLRFPFLLLRYFGVALRGQCTTYLTIAQSRRGFFRDAVVIWIGALLHRRMVCHLHGGNYDRFYAEQPAPVQWLIRRTLLKTHCIIILSERLRSMFQFEPAIYPTLRIVSNGLPLDLGGCSETKHLPSHPREPIQILYLSNLIESKGYFDLLRAVELLVNRYKLNVEAHFCGAFVRHGDDCDPGSLEQMEHRFFEFIRQHRLGSHVHFHGPVLGTEKIALLRSSHIFVLPTNYSNEGQPISIIEALAYGTVVVSTAFRAIPDMVIEGVNGRLVPFRDPERLAEVLAEIAADPEGYSRMSAAAYQHYLSQYTGQAYISALLDSLCTETVRAPETRCTSAKGLGNVLTLENQTTRASQYFNRIAPTWSTKYSAHGTFRRRLSRFLMPLREELPAGSRVLDFGCGTGELSQGFCDAQYHVSALDSSAAMIEHCRKMLAGTPAQFLQSQPSAWSRIDTPNGWFDAVVASSVFEYIEQVEPQLTEIGRVLRAGGLLLLTVPNPRSLMRRFERVLRTVLNCIVPNPIRALMPDRAESYLTYLDLSINHWPLERWTGLLLKSGFEDIKVQADQDSLAFLRGRRTR